MDNHNKKTKAKIFLENLLNEGAKVPCDKTSKSFNENKSLPPFYDEELFKKGQKFYHRNIFSIFSCKLFGLLSVLSIPSIRKILIHTQKSGSELMAFRRYVATVFHMTIWYDNEFKPGSRLWQSIAEVKNLHSSASEKSCSAGLHRISQKDMVLTQFGFMGYALVRTKSFGIFHATNEELEGFIHLWNVVGHLMGIEDRFNLCNGTLKETKEICNLMIDEVFQPYFEQKDKDFLQMAYYMINGLWCMSPILCYNVVLGFARSILNEKDEFNNNNPTANFENYGELSLAEKINLYVLLFMLYMLQWDICRIFFNYTIYIEIWLMHNLPFLAYLRFGIKKSQVKILVRNKFS